MDADNYIHKVMKSNYHQSLYMNNHLNISSNCQPTNSNCLVTLAAWVACSWQQLLLATIIVYIFSQCKYTVIINLAEVINFSFLLCLSPGRCLTNCNSNPWQRLFYFKSADRIDHNVAVYLQNCNCLSKNPTCSHSN